jgi:hypothetical protein
LPSCPAPSGTLVPSDGFFHLPRQTIEVEEWNPHCTLTLLAIHVDPSFLTGSLHHDRGILLSAGLVMLVPVLMLLRRGGKRLQDSGAMLQ